MAQNQHLISISVVVTVLNEAHTIEKLVESLVKQTVQAREVIIVDGGSTDGTKTILESLVKKHSALKIFTKLGNRSVGRNWGIEKSTSQVIAITDAGCIPHPNWLEELLKKYQAVKYQTTKGVVIAGYYDAQTRTPFEEAVVPYVLVMPDKVNPDDFLPATRSLLLEKNVWKSVGGFDEGLSDNEDYAFAKKIAGQKEEVVIVFAAQAKVTWIPRSTLKSFAWMIYRFARGDVQAGIVRPKVLFIFARYLFLILLLVSLLQYQQYGLLIFLTTAYFTLYSVWSIIKNNKYVPQGWYWLPVLQLTSDLMVIGGSIAGLRHFLATH